MTRKVLAVASEIFPLVKTGGLADVTGALPGALRPHEIEVTTLVPGYPAVMGALSDGVAVLTLPDLFGGPARIVRGSTGRLDLLAIDAPHLYGRAGNPYLDTDGRDWPDNAFRFAALGWTAARLALGDAPALSFDCLHCHDWQAGLAPAYLNYAGRAGPPTIITVHNLAFQGRFPRELLGALHLPPHAYAIDGVECYGEIGFLKAGLQFADRITTVSPSYAVEICTPEGGFGLDGLLRARSSVLSGIVNGIDTDVWNPAIDPLIAANYAADSLDHRPKNKRALQHFLGLDEVSDRPLFGVISRLSWQKGLDLLLAVAPLLQEIGAQLALLGTGEAGLEQGFMALAAEHPGRVAVRIGYDETLAHLIQAGSDALIVPSRFEPCGLTQLCALRYGALPLVARTGGLADTVADLSVGDGATGLVFHPHTPEALALALRRAAALWSEPARWRGVQLTGMATDVSWGASAARYAALYAELAPQ